MTANRIHVLMIEDNLIDQKAFQRFLKGDDYGIECTFATSLHQGYQMIDAQPFDAILVDYQLGDGTALDLLRTYKRRPIIVITGMGNEEIAIDAMRMGACDYLIKDVNSNYLKIIPMTLEHAILRWNDQQIRKLLYQTVQSISEAVFVTDRDDKVIFVNPAFQRMYGYESEEMLGKASSRIWVDNRDNMLSMESVLHRTSIEWSGRVRHRRSSGEDFDAMVSRSSVRNEEGFAFAVVGIARDITEETAIEAEREQLLSEIQSTLDKFRELNLPIPVSSHFGSLNDIKIYWNHVTRFLLDATQSVNHAADSGNGERPPEKEGKELLP